MPIQLYDSLTRRAVPFEPRDAGRAGIYCCEMTVYNYAPIGNMRTTVWFDLIRRYLAYRGFDVSFVMNHDFNSAEAFAALHELVSEDNKVMKDAQEGDESARAELSQLASAFLELTGVVGFTFDEEAAGSELAGELITYLLERRERARPDKDFAQADEIRDKLTELGVVIEDTPADARWRISALSH